jgi:hypothetical protein
MLRLQESVALHFHLGTVALTVRVFGVPLPDGGRHFAYLSHLIKKREIISDIVILLKLKN